MSDVIVAALRRSHPNRAINSTLSARCDRVTRGDIPGTAPDRVAAKERGDIASASAAVGAVTDAFAHVPVMLAEIVELLALAPAGVYLDATLGGGGHAEAVLDAAPYLRLVGLDRDDAALAASASRLARFGDRVTLHRCRFDELDRVLDELGVEEISAALFDLGVSSPQLDIAGRGFSFRHPGPLDMRMDRRQPTTAATLVNEYSADQLATILATYGDERFARRIAAAIVAARPITDTARLAEIVVGAIPAPARRHGGHPAKRSFQALRIAVNGELDALQPALTAALQRCRPGGRVAVLSYHSGEDRIVKACLRAATNGGCTCPAHLPCVCGAQPTARALRTHRAPSPAEQASNRRAASARLRAVERLEPAASGQPPTDAGVAR